MSLVAFEFIDYLCTWNLHRLTSLTLFIEVLVGAKRLSLRLFVGSFDVVRLYGAACYLDVDLDTSRLFGFAYESSPTAVIITHL